MSKFLKQYPALWTPKIGDRIRVIKVLDGDRKEVEKWDYTKNDTGIITHSLLNQYDEYVYNIKFDSYSPCFTVYKEEIEPVNE